MQSVSEIKRYDVKENEDQNGLQKIEKQFENYIFQVGAGDFRWCSGEGYTGDDVYQWLLT